MYQKEIVYMSLYKNGNRLGNAGFLKVEKRDREGSLSLTVKNAPRSISGRFPVRYYCGTDWKEVDGIAVRDGSGQWEKKEEESLEQIMLQIMLPGGYLIEGAGKAAGPVLKEERPSAEETERAEGERPSAEETERTESERPSEKETERAEGERLSGEETERAEGDSYSQRRAENAEPARIMEQASRERESGRQNRRVEYIAVERPSPRETVVSQETTTAGRVRGNERPSMPMPPMEGLKEDKWEQILDTYERIHPYGDERVYVKLEPKDFLILSSKYQHLVNNSFLLHGFYNYRHMILGKEGEEYYLGVPGVFYEREKMVALMFGFEAFERIGGENGQHGGGGPRAGEFGYYLRRVEL